MVDLLFFLNRNCTQGPQRFSLELVILVDGHVKPSQFEAEQQLEVL